MIFAPSATLRSGVKPWQRSNTAVRLTSRARRQVSRVWSSKGTLHPCKSEEPTKAALDLFYERIPKGGVIAFDQLNYKVTPGDTIATLESIGLNSHKVQRFYWDPLLSYIVKD